MCIQKTKYSNGLKDCNFHKPEEYLLQKVRKFLAQLSKTIRQSNIFSKFCFLKKFHQTRRMQIWQESWKAVIENLEIFRSKARTFIDNLSRKNPKNFFCTPRKQFWRTGRRIFDKSPKSIHSNSEKNYWKGNQNYRNHLQNSLKAIPTNLMDCFSQKIENFLDELLNLMKQTFFSGKTKLLSINFVWTRRMQFWQPNKKLLRKLPKSFPHILKTFN